MEIGASEAENMDVGGTEQRGTMAGEGEEPARSAGFIATRLPVEDRLMQTEAAQSEIDFGTPGDTRIIGEGTSPPTIADLTASFLEYDKIYEGRGKAIDEVAVSSHCYHDSLTPVRWGENNCRQDGKRQKNRADKTDMLATTSTVLNTAASEPASLDFEVKVPTKLLHPFTETMADKAGMLARNELIRLNPGRLTIAKTGKNALEGISEEQGTPATTMNSVVRPGRFSSATQPELAQNIAQVFGSLQIATKAGDLQQPQPQNTDQVFGSLQMGSNAGSDGQQPQRQTMDQVFRSLKVGINAGDGQAQPHLIGPSTESRNQSSGSLYRTDSRSGRWSRHGRSWDVLSESGTDISPRSYHSRARSRSRSRDRAENEDCRSRSELEDDGSFRPRSNVRALRERRESGEFLDFCSSRPSRHVTQSE